MSRGGVLVVRETEQQALRFRVSEQVSSQETRATVLLMVTGKAILVRDRKTPTIVVLTEKKPAPILERETLAPLLLVSQQGMRGRTGPIGPAGPPGTGYIHHQTTPASSWVVNHGFTTAQDPTVLLDSDPHVPVWTDVEIPSAGTTVLIFPQPETGYAYL